MATNAHTNMGKLCEGTFRLTYVHTRLVTYHYAFLFVRKSIGKLPYPTRLPWKLVIGRIGNNPNRAYITQISEENPDKEVYVVYLNTLYVNETRHFVLV